MIGISIGKLITLFLIIFFVLNVFKALRKLQDRKDTQKTKSQSHKKKDDDIVDLEKDKDGKYR